MNEEKQYLQNEGDSSLSMPEQSPVAFSAEDPSEFSGPSEYASEQHITMNGETLPSEAFEFSPEMVTEWGLLNPEEKVEAIEMIQEAMLLANVETDNIAAEKAAKVSSLGTAFAVAEVTPSSGEESVPQVGELSESPFWKRAMSAIYETAGKGARAAAIAATLGVATIAPMKSAQAGFFDQFTGTSAEQTIRRADRIMRGNQELQNIKQQQEEKLMRIEQLDREKAELVRQTSSNTRVDQIQSKGENEVRSIEDTANYEAQKAELEARYAEVDAQEANIDARYETSRMDKSFNAGVEANYKAEKARLKAQRLHLKAQGVRIDAQYKMNQVREDARVDNTGARISREAGNLGDRISRIEMEQERLRSEIKQLNIQKTQRIWETGRDVAR